MSETKMKQKEVGMTEQPSGVAMYQPELGQGIFGQPWQPMEVPKCLEHALWVLAYVLPVNEYGGNAFDNSGARFECDAFKVHAYSWNEDEEQQWNFAWRDLRVSWYKYLGRGMSVNRAVSIQELAEMLSECLAALMQKEREG